MHRDSSLKMTPYNFKFRSPRTNQENVVITYVSSLLSKAQFREPISTLSPPRTERHTSFLSFFTAAVMVRKSGGVPRNLPMRVLSHGFLPASRISCGNLSTCSSFLGGIYCRLLLDSRKRPLHFFSQVAGSPFGDWLELIWSPVGREWPPGGHFPEMDNRNYVELAWLPRLPQNRNDQRAIAWQQGHVYGEWCNASYPASVWLRKIPTGRIA